MATTDTDKAARPRAPRVEQRAVTAQVRMVTGDDGRPKVRGYGLVYGQWSQVLEEEDGNGTVRRFRERIMPGAGKRSLADADLRVLCHHDPKMVLGRRSAGTARFGEDTYGIWYEADPPNASYARDMVESLTRGDIDSSSFRFAAIDDEWDDADENGVESRSVRDCHVFEMGPVSWPAYTGARAVYRAAAPTAPPVVYPTPAQVRLLNQLRLAELA